MTATRLTIDDVNALDERAFVARFGHVYESTPELAAAASHRRPFADHAELVDAFRTVSDALDEPRVLALLRAHPQLAAAGPMTPSSQDEQRSAGLTDLDDATRARIVAANTAYLQRFGFPFIIAVRGLGPADVADALDTRLTHDGAEERATALAQVQRIAELRIHELVAP